LPHYTSTRPEGRAADLTVRDGRERAMSWGRLRAGYLFGFKFRACWIPTTHLRDGVQLGENQCAWPFAKRRAATKINGNKQTLFSFCYVQNQISDSKLHLLLDFYQRLCDVPATFLV
jgi:hypothetical protein